MRPFKKHVFVCTNERPAGHPKGSCARKGSVELLERFKQRLAGLDLKGTVRANASGCLGCCVQGCTVVVYPDAVWYGGVTLADVDAIVDQHLVGNVPVERLRIDHG